MAIDPIDLRPSSHACKEDDVSEIERRFDLEVIVPLRATPGYLLKPWLRITANAVTEDIGLAAGITVQRIGQRHEDDDGA